MKFSSLPHADDPELDATSEALRYLTARAGRRAATELPRDPFPALERLRRRVVPVLPEGWALAIHEYGSACNFAEAPGYYVILPHEGRDCL